MKKYFYAGIFILILSADCFSADVPVKGKLRIEPSIFWGFAMQNIKIGETTTGSDVTISGGGGFGGLLCLSYGMSEKVNLDFGIGLRSSSLSPPVNNASGNFSRNLFLVTAKYLMPVRIDTRYKFGIGLGQYTPGNMTLDLSDGGLGVQSIKYDPVSGIHLTFDFERYSPRKYFWSLGIRYSIVKYTAKNFSIDNMYVPVSLLRDEFVNLDGSSFDLVAALKF